MKPMNTFQMYAKYYDLLYSDKDYTVEARFVSEKIKGNGGEVKSILELGCGTGRHASELVRMDSEVTGIDLSHEMVIQAERRRVGLGYFANKLTFLQGDVRAVRIPRCFSSVVSLFHVMSYQVSNNDLLSSIQTAGAHLEAGGLFLFDFWYGPGVLSDMPKVRIKRMQDDAIEVVRLAEPVVRTDLNIVDVKYEIILRNKLSGIVETVRENHSMRYFFIPELEIALRQVGFETLNVGSWLDAEPIARNPWCAYIVARKM
jgi:SAM-dependent methyltransferase